MQIKTHKVKRWVLSSSYQKIDNHFIKKRNALSPDDYSKYLKSFKYRRGTPLLSFTIRTNDVKMFQLLLTLGFDPTDSRHSGRAMMTDINDSDNNGFTNTLVQFGINVFIPDDLVCHQKYYHQLPIAKVTFDTFMDKLNTSDNHVNYPNQMLIVGIVNNNIDIVSRALQFTTIDFDWDNKITVSNYIYSNAVIRRLFIRASNDILHLGLKNMDSDRLYNIMIHSLIVYKNHRDLRKIRDCGFVLDQSRVLKVVIDDCLRRLSACNDFSGKTKYHDGVISSVRDHLKTMVDARFDISLYPYDQLDPVLVNLINPTR